MSSPKKEQKLDFHILNHTILRAYDIRGIVGETLDNEDALAIGRALATYIINKLAKPAQDVKIAVGYDGRISSPSLESAIVRGIKSTGAIAVRVGLGPTPMLYYAVREYELDGGVMITGSHNPPSHNGFKFMCGKKALFGEEIQQLGRISAEGEFIRGDGAEEHLNLFSQYVDRLAKDFSKGHNDLKIAWDSGNGAAGEVMEKLASKLPFESILLNKEIDGNFPSHHPDPSDEKNLQQLIEVVKNNSCDVGIAFDGDGDRIGVVDSIGRVIWGDQLMIIFAGDVLADNPRAKIIADVKASQILFNEIAKMGGEPIIWKTGHSFIKDKMVQTGALLAGEMSGHIFFADKYYGFDDGIYAAVRLLNFLASSELSLKEIVDELPVAINTPEIRIEVVEERKFDIVNEVKARLQENGTNFSDIDGVRVMSDKGWWLLRASNTQAALVARVEANDENSLDDLKNELKQQMSLSGVEIEI